MNSWKTKRQLDIERRYQTLVERFTPNHSLAMNIARAFLWGGAICTLGQCVSEIGKVYLGLDQAGTSAFTAIVMVFLGAFLTGIGQYDRIGKHAGAGSIVPITGFANSIVSAAMEFRREGLVLGIGARMFIIAGPVLVYGVGASVIVGLAAYVVSLF
ncbi:MAG: stage V sporulation protein AC [Oscillospiraceae bacterium]|jgi:stage V sporulation protein AC|nr:stage V sporulation protein AC [Oscillospiraceae bacterium]